MDRLALPVALFALPFIACGGKTGNDASTSGAESTGETGETGSEGTESGEGDGESTDSTDETGDTGDQPDMMVEPACEDLDEDECAAEPDCEPVILNRVIQDFIGNEKWCIAPDTDYLGCRDTGIDCPPQVLVVCEDDNGPHYYAPDGCLPPGPDWMICDTVGDLQECE
jgi:hypothetical protein